MDLREVERDEDLTPKQQLVKLANDGHLTKLQLRAGARRLDELIEKGSKAPLKTVLKELQTGKVTVGARDKESEDELPRLTDAPKTASSKQKLLFLRNEGSLSPNETRIAARALDQGKNIESALIEAGAERLLETVPVEEDTPATNLSMKGIVDQNLDDLEKSVEKLDNKVVALELLRLEAAGKDRDGGKETLSAKAQELGASEEEVQAAIDAGHSEKELSGDDSQEDGDPKSEEDGDPEDEEDEGEDSEEETEED